VWNFATLSPPKKTPVELYSGNPRNPRIIAVISRSWSWFRFGVGFLGAPSLFSAVAPVARSPLWRVSTLLTTARP